MYKKCTINFLGLKHLEATRGRFRNERQFLKVYLILKCGVSKFAELKMLKDCTIILKAWTIWGPPGAVLENKKRFWKVYFNISKVLKCWVSKVEELKTLKKYNNIRRFDHFMDCWGLLGWGCWVVLHLSNRHEVWVVFWGTAFRSWAVLRLWAVRVLAV